jgi:hypothetical protein
MTTTTMKCVCTCGWRCITEGHLYTVYKIRYDGYQTLFFIFGDDKQFHWIPCNPFEPVEGA